MFGRQGAASGATGATSQERASDDVRLLERIGAKDLRAFETLYRDYHPRLTRFLNVILRRPHLVEEVLNDTMLVVWKQPERYNGRSKVSTWIFAIAYRKALKALSRHDEPVEDLDADLRPSGEAGPEQQLGRRQVQELLLDAIGGLSADHRAVVDLTYFHEIGYREIAELMDCPVDTVKTRMFHARRRLRDKLPGRLADWL
ncbi:MAG TPA: sigma-70 family RNA polymerase sigma factor [Caulobacteraceae bacterium]|nr:sigma-70 family RNA polymerase sigma factor [Caulobacteraceae bacterium]